MLAPIIFFAWAYSPSKNRNLSKRSYSRGASTSRSLSKNITTSKRNKLRI